MADAAAWCALNSKPLLLAEIMRSDLSSLGEDLGDIAELNLYHTSEWHRESLAAVPVKHWWDLIERAEKMHLAQPHQMPWDMAITDAATPDEASAARKKRDGRTTEARAARLAQQGDK